MIFDMFHNKTIYTGVITAIDPIHIGSAGIENIDPTKFDNTVLKDANGNPLIPGASLKGVVRSNFEAVMRSVGKKVCDIFDNNDVNCLTNSDIKAINASKTSNEKKANQCYEKSCDVCRLFGGRGIASKLQFKDCTFIGDKCVFEYRDGVGIDRETGAAKRSVKYDFEIIPKGTQFAFYMIAENVDDEQANYVSYILKMLESGELCVGGKTTRGLGRIKLDQLEVKEITVDDLKQQLGL